jgi:glycosyltransferase involved in cell wall biosynthesis
MAMKVSIVIPTFNEEDYVSPVLSDIARQSRRADEVIVVDGKSEDATASVVERFPGVNLLIGAPPWQTRETWGDEKPAAIS